jgi:hypothetical protein
MEENSEEEEPGGEHQVDSTIVMIKVTDPDLCRNTMKCRNTHKRRDAVEIRLHFINNK